MGALGRGRLLRRLHALGAGHAREPQAPHLAGRIQVHVVPCALGLLLAFLLALLALLVAMRVAGRGEGGRGAASVSKQAASWAPRTTMVPEGGNRVGEIITKVLLFIYYG